MSAAHAIVLRGGGSDRPGILAIRLIHIVDTENGTGLAVHGCIIASRAFGPG